MNRQTANELRFAYKVRQALYESTQTLSAAQLERLAAARKAALQVQKPEAAIQWLAGTVRAGQGSASADVFGSGSEPGFFGRLGLALCLVVLVGATLTGLFQHEFANRITDLAEIDTGLLIDPLPISAYADHGFNAYLKRNP